MSELPAYLKKYSFKDAAITVVLTLTYFLAGKLGLQLAFSNPSATPIWAPTGIALAAFLLLGFEVWPAVLIGAFLVNLTTAGTVATSIGIAIGNTLEGIVGALLINHFIGRKNIFVTPGGVFKYVVAGMFATLVSATFGATTLFLGGLVHSQDYVSVWSTWWLGDLGGALLIAPIVLLWATDRSFPKKISKIIELIAAFSVLILVSQFVFTRSSWDVLSNYSLVFLPIPILVWIAFRFGPREASSALFTLYVIAALGTLQGVGPFVREDPNQSLLILQIFMVIMFIGKMPLAAASLQVKESEEKYRKLIATSPDAILVTDLEGRIKFIDKQVLKLFGLKDETDMVGKSGFEFIAPEDLPKTQAALGDIIKNGSASDIQYISLRKDGSRFYTSTNASVIYNDRGIPEGIMIVAHDISKEKEIDKAKSDFFAMAAHQLRAPLSAMHWNIELLLSDKTNNSPSESMKKKLEDIYKNNQQLVGLVKDLLNVSRLEQGVFPEEPEVVDVMKVIQSVIDEMKVVADKKSITLHVRSEGELTKIIIDPDHFREAFSNLISNAIKFSHEKDQVDIVLAEKENTLRLEVADKGIGIPTEEKEKIFSKFYRTALAKDLDPEGTGIGLFMVKQYVEKIGGKIWFESPTIGKIGTTFYIEIPIKEKI